MSFESTFSPAHLGQLRTSILVVLLIMAAAIDFRTMRIPNRLTVSGAVIGVALSAALGWAELGPRWAVDGALWSLAGLGVGLLLLLPLYLLRVMGAGDVKLMGMVGAYVGLQQILPTVACVFITGGIAAVAFALWQRSLRRVSANLVEIIYSAVLATTSGLRPDVASGSWRSVGKLPYGVSICVGTLAWVAFKHF